MLLAAGNAAPLMGKLMAVELTGQWSLLPYILFGSVIGLGCCAYDLAAFALCDCHA